MLEIYRVILDVVKELRPVIGRIERCDSDLGRQMRRAAASVALNVAEGMGSSGGNRTLRYRNALGRCRRRWRACTSGRRSATSKAWTRRSKSDASGRRHAGARGRASRHEARGRASNPASRNRLRAELPERADDVVNGVTQARVGFDVAEGLADLDACEGLAHGAHGVVIPRSAIAALRVHSFADVSATLAAARFICRAKSGSRLSIAWMIGFTSFTTSSTTP